MFCEKFNILIFNEKRYAIDYLKHADIFSTATFEAVNSSNTTIVLIVITEGCKLKLISVCITLLCFDIKKAYF